MNKFRKKYRATGHGRNWSSGYAEFRYGPAKRKPVSLPPIFTDKQRQSVVDAAIDNLRDWQSSPWEDEAEVRNTLRRKLVLRGNGWSISDNEAANVVRRAFGILGRGVDRRPTWREGQKEFTIPVEQCQWCGGDLDSEDLSKKRHYCSDVCSKMAKLARAEGLIGKGNGEPLEPIACAQCATMFKPVDRKRRYCSRECFIAAKVTLEDRECEQCGTTFHPLNEVQRFCCRECVTAWRATAMEPRQCELCSKTFQPRSERARFCSKRCQKTAFNRRKASDRRAEIAKAGQNVVSLRPVSPAVFDEVFVLAA